MTQEQLSIASAMLAKINRMERELTLFEEGFEREDLSFIMANIDLHADYLRPYLADFCQKAYAALKAERDRATETFATL